MQLACYEKDLLRLPELSDFYYTFVLSVHGLENEITVSQLREAAKDKETIMDGLAALMNTKKQSRNDDTATISLCPYQVNSTTELREG